MLAKLTSKNHLTLPKSIIAAVGAAEYFDVETRNGQIVLTPVRIQRSDAVRAELAELNLSEQDVADAVARAHTSRHQKVTWSLMPSASSKPRVVNRRSGSVMSC